MKPVWLVIPAFNEGRRLHLLIKKILSLKLNLPLVIVDDGSRQPITNHQPAVTVLRHAVNLGKGAALKTGAAYAFAHHAQAVIFMDADGQHRPDDLPHFLRHLDDGYDLVLGSRRSTLDTPPIRFLGNKFASVYINLLFGVYVSDLLSGYRALTKKAFRLLAWQSPGYGVETEMIARLGRYKHQLKYLEFPISTIYHDKYKGVTIVDALQIFAHTLWWKLS